MRFVLKNGILSPFFDKVILPWLCVPMFVVRTTDDEKLNINTLNVILSKFNEHGALKDDTLKSNLDGFITIYSLNNKIKEDEYINTFYRRVKEKCDELNNNS